MHFSSVCLLCGFFSLQETYEAKRNEFLGELQKKEEEMRQMFVMRVKEKEAELKEAEKEVGRGPLKGWAPERRCSRISLVWDAWWSKYLLLAPYALS